MLKVLLVVAVLMRWDQFAFAVANWIALIWCIRWLIALWPLIKERHQEHRA